MKTAILLFCVYPYFLHVLENGLVELVPLNVLSQGLCELIRHAAGQDVTLNSGRASLGLHHEEVGDIQLQQIHDELLWASLLEVTPSHRFQELQQELVVLGIFEAVGKGREKNPC